MSGTHGALRLIELTSARLCRDVSDLVGSLDSAVLTLADATSFTRAREKATRDAIRTLTITLDLRLAAWGPNPEPLSLTRLRFLAGGLPERITVDVSALNRDIVFPPPRGRILLNLLLLAADSLPAGGVVILAGAADDLFVRITGSAAAWPTGMAVCLSDETEARSALTEEHNLQMALTALLAHAARIRLSVLLAPTAGLEPAILRLGG